jgi:hypothetical protein
MIHIHDCAKLYMEWMKKAHDQSILRRSFEPGHGAIEIEDPKNGTTFKVNGQRLKPFLELMSLEIETTLLEDPSYSNRWSSIVESMAED